MSTGPRRVASSGRALAGVPAEVAELIQRGWLRLEVARVDLAASEARLGAFHETTWYFRQALAEARQGWESLRAMHGTAGLDAALAEPPRAVLRLGRPGGGEVVLVPMGGSTFRVEAVAGTPLAPVQWRLTRLDAGPGEDPYFATRGAGGGLQCDCGEWTFRVADGGPGATCKHLAALRHLGWI
jgi:hypothetical protein